MTGRKGGSRKRGSKGKGKGKQSGSGDDYCKVGPCDVVSNTGADPAKQPASLVKDDCKVNPIEEWFDSICDPNMDPCDAWDGATRKEIPGPGDTKIVMYVFPPLRQVPIPKDDSNKGPSPSDASKVADPVSSPCEVEVIFDIHPFDPSEEDMKEVASYDDGTVWELDKGAMLKDVLASMSYEPFEDMAYY